MYVYVVCIIYPYDGLTVETVYTKEKSAKQHVLSWNTKYSKDKIIDGYARYFLRELKEEFDGGDL